MTAERQQIKIGLTDSFPCSYLRDQKERVAVVLDNELHCDDGYDMLLANGFRRSGEMIYKPHCDRCQACHAMRISVRDFSLSRSQKRLLNKARHLRWEIKQQMDQHWFELYQRYIESRHKNGSMYPPKRDEFAQFSHNHWLTTRYLHVYDGETLIAIAVTDQLPTSLSAFYTFFDPEHPLSLGTLAVLFQAAYATQINKQWLYLGYQVDDCPAMNYKVRFQRHQRLVNHRWQG